MTDAARIVLALAAANQALAPISMGYHSGGVPTSFHFRSNAAKRAKLRRRLGR